jgi:hypothetical protein
MVPYTSLCRVSITPISELEVDERFRHIHRPYYPSILWENEFCVVTCASHDIALMFMENFRRNPRQELDWYLDTGEEIDPATFPLGHPGYTYEGEGEDHGEDTLSAVPEDYYDDEDKYHLYENEFEHPDLCHVCRTDYVDPWGNCQHCRAMNTDMYGNSRRPNYRWF